MSKVTKGTWYYEDFVCPEDDCLFADYCLIVKEEAEEGNSGKAVALVSEEPDARLITYAKDMYKLLCAIRSYWHNNQPRAAMYDYSELLDELVDAINVEEV